MLSGSNEGEEKTEEDMEGCGKGGLRVSGLEYSGR